MLPINPELNFPLFSYLTEVEKVKPVDHPKKT